jgi:hypothetical protein
MRIQLRDSSPPQVVLAEAEWDRLGGPFPQEAKERLKSLLSTVKTGPREAAMAATEAGAVSASDSTIGSYLFLIENHEAALGTPIAWFVSYADINEGKPVRRFVSPLTGEVLKSDEPTATEETP